MTIRQRLNLIGLLACLIGGIVVILEVKGTEVSLAPLLTIFFTGVCVGALLTDFIRGFRK